METNRRYVLTWISKLDTLYFTSPVQVLMNTNYIGKMKMKLTNHILCIYRNLALRCIQCKGHLQISAYGTFKILFLIKWVEKGHRPENKMARIYKIAESETEQEMVNNNTTENNFFPIQKHVLGNIKKWKRLHFFKSKAYAQSVKSLPKGFSIF